MACPIPHTRRDQFWLTFGLALGAGFAYFALKPMKPKDGDLRHVVLLKVKDETPESVLNDFVNQANALQTKIPGILSYNAGRDLGFKGTAPNHPIAITATFKDQKDYEAYAAHPEHVKVVDIIRPWLAQPGGRSAAQIHA